MANSFEERLVVDLPFIVYFPLSGFSRVPKICNNVVLPAPEAPTIEIISPLLISKSIPLRIGRSS